MADRASRLSIAVAGFNVGLLAIFVANWTGLVPAGDPFTVIVLGLLICASLVSVLLVLRARDGERELKDLRTSEERLRALFEHSPICMDMKDVDGVYLMVNRAYCDWLSKKPGDIVGKSNAVVYASDPERRATVDKIERGVAETRQKWNKQIEVVREGRVHERLLVKFPVEDEDGEVVAVGTIAVDLTEQKEAEEALDRERERTSHLESILREAIMAMPSGFAIFDEKDRLVICNAEMARFNPSFRDDPDNAVGLTYQQILTESVETGQVPDLKPGEEAAFIEERLEKHRAATGDPEELLFLSHICIMTETRMPNGGTIVLRQDVTEQRRLERERQEAEDLLRNLFENFDQGITVRDRNSRVVRINKAACEWAELPAEDVLGKTTPELLRVTGHHDEAEDVLAEEQALMAERRKDVLMRSRIMADGSTRYTRLSRFPIIGADGEVQGLAALGYDVTELIEAQQALERSKEGLEATVLERTRELRTSERRFRSLAQGTADWFWECDADLRLTYVSEGFPFPEGMDADTVIGMSIPDYYADLKFDPEISARLIAALQRREPVRDLEFMRPLDGEMRMCRITVMPIWEDGEFTGYTGSTADISELDQARKSLVESERLASLGSLVAGVAHEINTPIGICVTAGSTVSSVARKLLSQMREGGIKRSEFESGIATIVEGTELVDSNLERAARLISSFKSVAVDQTSEAERAFNLLDYAREVIESLSPQLGRENIRVEITGDEDIDLKSYPGAIAQIMTNLVMNSIVHGFADKDSGNITIEISSKDDTATLIYRDDGCGMSAETARRVFEPFFTTRLGQGGSGLGMHILFNLVVQVLDGSVQCRSEPGSGVEFDIRFPVRALATA